MTTHSSPQTVRPAHERDLSTLGAVVASVVVLVGLAVAAAWALGAVVDVARWAVAG